jgi:hypothetical protein
MLIFALAVTLTLLTTGCHRTRVVHESDTIVVHEPVVVGGGPPPWAPAHGHRRKMNYHYYPSCEVYHNIDSGQWVWLEAGNWRVGTRLPDSIHARLGDHVSVEIAGDRPQTYHHDIVARYPAPERRNGPAEPGSRGRGRGRGRPGGF